MAAIQPHAPAPTAEDKPADPDNMKKRSNSAGDEKPMSSNVLDPSHLVLPRESASELQPMGTGGEHPDYSSNVYAPQAQALFYRGFDNGHSEWDECMPFVHPEGLEVGSPGVYNDNSSLLFHSGYGYSHQMPYGPYSPVTTPIPSVSGEPQMYSQQFRYSTPPYYQPLVSPTVPYVTSTMPVSQPDFTNLASLDQRGDSVPFGSRPVYPSAGPFSGGSFPGGTGTVSFQDSQQGFDGIRSGGRWSDSSKPSDRPRSLVPFSPSVSPQPIGPNASFGKSIGVTSQQQKSYGNFYGRGYLPNHGTSFAGNRISSLGTVNRSWISLESSTRRGRGSSSPCSYNGSLDILIEQNRGPRASKTKIQVSAENVSSADSIKHSTSVAKSRNESINLPDFVTEYNNAKFFVIKSYTEDNVHKSIKYGVWASTPNGNRKLDAAYRQAKEHDICPVFLFFSVNASSQFCGVAEMIGPVDFDKSVDYWQQDKWTGQFPLRWHIIKDVPNSQFRHILLENNDNKPVTNSRDTQEVKLEQGVEILKIFKNCENDSSILDDFDFYEDRQKAMQERKAQQQVGMMAVGVTEESAHENAATAAPTGGFIKQMTKSFAQVVCLDERSKETALSERGSAVPKDSKVVVANFDDDMRVPISSDCKTHI